MKSDLVVMKEMLDKSGIPYEEANILDGYAGKDIQTEIAVKGVKGDDHFIGHADFVSSMYFGVDGELVKMGAWE